MPARLHWSQLRWMARSPAHYRYYLDHPQEPTDAMRLGTLVHHLVLLTETKYRIWTGKQRRGKEWDAWLAETVGLGLEPLRQEEWDRANEIATAVLEHPLAQMALTGAVEQVIRWSIGDRECAGRPDVVSDLFVTDLKTAADASPQWFARHSSRMGYLGQLAWYLDGLRAGGRPDVDTARIVAVETKPPYAVQVYELDESALEQGRRHYRALFERLLVCEASDYWPAYSDTVLPLEGYESTSVVIEGEEIQV